MDEVMILLGLEQSLRMMEAKEDCEGGVCGGEEPEWEGGDCG